MIEFLGLAALIVFAVSVTGLLIVGERFTLGARSSRSASSG